MKLAVRPWSLRRLESLGHVEVLELLIDQVQVEILLPPGHLKLLDGAADPDGFVLCETGGILAPTTKMGFSPMSSPPRVNG